MKVKEIMSKQVACVNSNDTIEKAAQLMKQYNVGSIPVCSQDNVVGIVTDRDLALRSIAKSAQQNCVQEVMSSNPVTGSPEMEVHEAAKIMGERQIRRLPIVDNNHLVGIVALGDISIEPQTQDNAEQALKNISQPNGMQM